MRYTKEEFNATLKHLLAMNNFANAVCEKFDCSETVLDKFMQEEIDTFVSLCDVPEKFFSKDDFPLWILLYNTTNTTICIDTLYDDFCINYQQANIPIVGIEE